MPHTETDEPLDTIYVNTTLHLSWRDRLRVLFGRPVHVDTQTDIWNAHKGDGGRFICKTRSHGWVEPIRKPKPVAYELVQEPVHD